MGKWDKYKVSGEGSTESKWDKYKVSPAVSEERVAEKSPEMEKQNLMGQIFNVPGAAIRSAIQGKGFVQGAVNPSSVPTFQDTALNSYYGKLPNFPGKTALGMGVSALGMAGDVLTNPADMALALAGKAPGVNKAVGAVRKLAPAQAFEQWLTKERSVVESMPRIMTDNWLTGKAKNVKDIVDNTITGFRSQYKSIFSKVKDKPVSGLKTIPADMLEEYGLGPKPTMGQLWEARDTLLRDIADGSWNNPGYYKKIKPRQEDLKEAATKIKAVFLNNLDDATRNEVLKIDPGYEKAMKSGRKILSTVYDAKSGEIKTDSLVNLFENKKDAGARQLFRGFSEFDKNILQAEKDITKYINRQRTKKAFEKMGGLGLAGYMTHRYLTDKAMKRK